MEKKVYCIEDCIWCGSNSTRIQTNMLNDENLSYGGFLICLGCDNCGVLLSKEIKTHLKPNSNKDIELDINQEDIPNFVEVAEAKIEEVKTQLVNKYNEVAYAVSLYKENPNIKGDSLC